METTVHVGGMTLSVDEWVHEMVTVDTAAVLGVPVSELEDSGWTPPEVP